MSNDKSSQDQPKFEKISPARIDITASGQPNVGPATEKEQHPGQRKVVIAGFFVLLFMTFGVIFVLPTIIDKPVLEPAQPANENNGVDQSPVSELLPVSPWQEAQQIRLRKEAQAVLASLLEKQVLLEDKQIQLWGEQRFNQSKDIAKDGDLAFQQKAFDLAVGHYQQALEGMESLLEDFDNLIEQLLLQGESALKENRADLAVQSFSTVLNIDPEHSRAQSGLARTRARSEALPLMAQAASLEQEGRLEEALQVLKQAWDLSPDFPGAKEGRQRLAGQILERDFNDHMSQGFVAISGNNYRSAKTAFSQALKLKPESKEARDGLEQAQFQITRNSISQLRLRAEQQTGREQWQSAAKSYSELLKLDSSLQFARLGKQLADTRAQLDGLLNERIDHPERLSSDSVFRETQKLVNVAKQIERPGPRLIGQITRLETQLRLATMPVKLLIQSDGQTEVSIKKVADLGKFARHEIWLKPGTYILVGKRLGYRDVREEVNVLPVGENADVNGKMNINLPVVIRCNEQI